MTSLPEILQLPEKMSSPNHVIEIYSGKVVVKNSKYAFTLTGTLAFHWLPERGCLFTGTGSIELVDMIDLMNLEEPLQLYIQDHLFSAFRFTRTTSGPQSEVRGFCGRLAVLGDRNIAVSRVTFGVPNLRELYGTGVSEKESGLHNNRITLTTAKHTVILDKLASYNALQDSLKNTGGYLLQYAGEITPLKGSISFVEQQELMGAVNNFLTLINGRRTAGMFLHGYHGQEILWKDFTPYSVDGYRYLASWAPRRCRFEPQEMWQHFYALWAVEEDRDFLTSVVHWYVEANAQSGYVEGALMMAQAALELIYNWYLVERKKRLSADDAEKISTAGKIRLLLAEVGLTSEIPAPLEHLRQWISSSHSTEKDGPETIVQLRNAVVHSKPSKRTLLRALDVDTKGDALDLYLWYIELSILFILRYKGKYVNRCSGQHWVGADEEWVPWVNPGSKEITA